jgi:hypothetical protein
VALDAYAPVALEPLKQEVVQVSMTNAERQAAYRARRKAEMEALRNGTPISTEAISRKEATIRNVRDANKKLKREVACRKEEVAALRNSITKLKEEVAALHNKAPSRNGKCRNCEKLQNELKGARMWSKSLERKLESKEIPFNVLQDAIGKATITLRNNLDKEKAKRRRAVEKLKVLRNARNELLPDEIKQGLSSLKSGRTRLQRDRALFEARKSISKKLGSDEIRLIKNCLHPDRCPEDKRDRFNKAFSAFKGAVE